MSEPKAGVGVDSRGNPAVDPTKNVLDLVDAANRRQDDLRQKDREISDIQHRHQSEITKLLADQSQIVGKLREEYQEKISHAESGRLDSIRQVDREEVAKTAVAANTAITTLAKQTNDLAVTLAKTVADTAAAAEARNSAQYSDTNKRLSALELSSSEGKGKQQVSDPAMERLAAVVEKLAGAQERRGGGGDTVKWAALAISMAVGLIAIGTFVFVTTRQSSTAAVAPQVIYVPAPAAGQGAPLPGTVR